MNLAPLENLRGDYAGMMSDWTVPQQLDRYSDEDHAVWRLLVERQSALGYGSYEDTLNALDAALTPGPYILGSRFSAVDVYVGSQIQWGLMVKGLDARPAFDRYMQQIAARPALQRLMKGAQSS